MGEAKALLGVLTAGVVGKVGNGESRLGARWSEGGRCCLEGLPSFCLGS